MKEMIDVKKMAVWPSDKHSCGTFFELFSFSERMIGVNMGMSKSAGAGTSDLKKIPLMISVSHDG